MKKKIIFNHCFLILIGLIIILPFVWMVTTSLSDPYHVFGKTLKIIPDQFEWKNYTDAYSKVPFAKFMINSFKIAIAVSFGQIITCSLAGYAFAKLQFPFKNFIFYVILGTLMIPIQVLLVPLYVIMKEFGILNTHWALILPFLTSPFGIFLMRQYFLSVPKTLEDAARVDGCNIPKFFWFIALPMARPMLFTLAVLAFIGSWGNFIAPLIFLNDLDLATVTLGLFRFSSSYSTNWPMLMAAAATTLIPSFILYLFAQKYIIKAYSMGGVEK